MVAFFGGSSSGKSIELAYAQVIAEFDVADATGHTIVAGLTFAFTPDSASKYCLEFYSASVEENSGTTVGDLMLVRILVDNVPVGYGYSVNGAGGLGNQLHIRTQTLTGDGLPHTVTVDVQNVTTGANGAIVYANNQTPAYIRACRL